MQTDTNIRTIASAADLLFSQRGPDLDAMRTEQAGLLADVDAGQRWIAETLDPLPGINECFRVFCLTTWGGWRTIYYGDSNMTRFLAVRCARAAADPHVIDMRVFRGDPVPMAAAVRQWCAENQITNLNLL